MFYLSNDNYLCIIYCFNPAVNMIINQIEFVHEITPLKLSQSMFTLSGSFTLYNCTEFHKVDDFTITV